MTDANEEIRTEMKSYFKNDNVKLPEGINFINESDSKYRMILNARKVQDENMQVDDNAFEGWAVCAYIALKDKINTKIILDVNEVFEFEQFENNGHLNRFLYRAMRFSEQYEWLELSQYLQDQIKDFYNHIKGGEFRNNVPNGEAGVKTNHNNENAVESMLAEPGVLEKVLINRFDIGNNAVYRQLPVGLFKDKVSDATRVFTGGKSAIDLWTWNKDEFSLVELKTLNPMEGIVTETFFYANYMRDLLLEEGLFTLNKIKKTNRGYSDILENKFRRINAIMLADQYHPTIIDETIDVLNAGKIEGINYIRATYSYDLKLKGI